MGVKNSETYAQLILHRYANFITISMMKLLTFDYHHLDVDWISFNIQGLTDPKTIASNLSNYFTPHVLIDDVPSIGFHGLKKIIRFLAVSVRDLRVTGLGLRLFSPVKCVLFL